MGVAVHMLEAFAVHGGFGLEVAVKGDLEVDCHHTIEDAGIVLGRAFCEALGDKSGIARYGSFLIPMDETLAAAAVDVTEVEPLPADSPLWQLENLVITPHISGGFHLPETFERIVDIAAENLRAYLAGRELRNVVDFATGYKK